jgi:hypothetical protein
VRDAADPLIVDLQREDDRVVRPQRRRVPSVSIRLAE